MKVAPTEAAPFLRWLHDVGVDAARRLTTIPGGLEGARERLEVHTSGRHLTISAVQLEVMMLLALGVDTMRDLAAVRGRGSTNGSNDILVALRRRELAERPAHQRGTRAPWRLTGIGWRVLGPCEHIVDALGSYMFEAPIPPLHVGGDSARPTIAPGRVMLPPPPMHAIGEPLSYCPWCGWRLW